MTVEEYNGKKGIEYAKNHIPKFDEKRVIENILSGEKIYVLDTNVFLDFVNAPLILSGNPSEQDYVGKYAKLPEHSGKNTVIIPYSVIYELDSIKDNPKKGPKRVDARACLRFINRLIDRANEQGENVYEGITLNNGAKIVLWYHDERDFEQYVEGLYHKEDGDKRILRDVEKIKETLREYSGIHSINLEEKIRNIRLVSMDVGMLSKSVEMGVNIKIETYQKGTQEDYYGVYPGVIIIEPNEKIRAVVDNLATGVSRIHDLEDILTNSTMISPNGRNILEKPVKIQELFPNQILKLLERVDLKDPISQYLRVSPDKKHVYGMNNYRDFLKETQEIETKSKNRLSEKELTESAAEIASKKLNQLREIINKSKRKSEEELRHNLLEKLEEATNELREGYKITSIKDFLSKFPFWKNYKADDNQIPLCELILADEITSVSVIGKQGTGKTVQALKMGLYLLYNSSYEKIVILRPYQKAGRGDLGLLPGGESEKMDPWARPIKEAIFDILAPEDMRTDELVKKTISRYIHNMEKSGMLEFCDYGYIQGRTLKNSLVLIEEAENFKKSLSALLMGRIGEGSKIIWDGDPNQIAAMEDERLSISNSGLINIANSLVNSPLSGSITLWKNMRSRTSNLAELLFNSE